MQISARLQFLAPAERITQVGLAGLYLFSFFAFLGQAGTAAGLFLMLFALLASFRQVRPVWRSDPAVWLAAAFVVYLALRGLAAANEFPQTATEQWTKARDWGRLVFFVVIAWWARGDRKRIWWVMGLALTGYFVHLLRDSSLADVELIVQGYRKGLAFPVMFAGILSGACLIAMLLLSPRVLKSPQSRVAKLLIGIVWLAAIAVVIQLLVAAQSRGAWFATIVSLAFSLALIFFRRTERRKLMALGTILGLVAFIGIQNTSTIEQRLTRNSETISAFLSGAGIEQIPIHDSAGARLHMLHYGLKRWMERPLFGWGPGTDIVKHFSADTFSDPMDKVQAEQLSRYAHLHNGFVTILAQLGIVGAVLLGSILFLAIRTLRLAARGDLLPYDLVAAVAGLLLLVLLSNLTNARFNVLDFQLLMVLILAVAYTTRYTELGVDRALQPIDPVHADASSPAGCAPL